MTLLRKFHLFYILVGITGTLLAFNKTTFLSIERKQAQKITIFKKKKKKYFSFVIFLFEKINFYFF